MTEGSERKNFLFWRNRLFLAVVHWPLGLLLATFRRAIFSELFDRRRTDHRVLRQALKETFTRLPALLHCRREFRGDDSDGWRRFLVPPGSVPVITLPGIGGEVEAEHLEEAREVNEVPRDVPDRDAEIRDPEIRNQLSMERARADRAEREHAHVRNEMRKIHASKMWKLWMRYLAVRRWIFG